MKRIAFSTVLSFLLLLTVMCSSLQNTGSQQESDGDAVAELLKTRRYQFTPTTAQTQLGRSIPVTGYRFQVRQDTLICYLPYYGVAHTPQIARGQGPLDFTSAELRYSSEAGKKGNTEIRIEPQSKFIDAQQFDLSVSSTGYATLRVRFNDRQPISFYGQVGKISRR
jgi:hypothetical protein